MVLILSSDLLAQQNLIGVVCLENIGEAERTELTSSLKKITGWSDLQFRRDGLLRLGNQKPVGGSVRARELLTQAVSGMNTIVLEDASRHSEVVFSRVMPSKWKYETPNSPRAFVIQIDFADFHHVTGDRMALQAFDVGWVVLHELDHIVNDSFDAEYSGETGECEHHINQMRRECHLPQRADYFYSLLPITPDSTFITRFVRLAFDQESAGNKKRYWLLWDASLVGGLDQQKQIASLK